VTSAVFRGEEGQGSVVLDVQAHGSGLALDGSQTVTVSYQALDMDGKIVTGAYKQFQLDLTSQMEATRIHGLRFVDRVALAPGRYELRLVVDQPLASKLGSVITHVDVPAPSSSLALSGVLLASLSTAEHTTLHGDETIRERLLADPTAVRRFPKGDELSVYTELYGDDKDVPDDLALAVSILEPDGKVLLTEGGRALDEVGAHGMAFRARLSLEDVEPGSYVLQVQGETSRDGVKPVLRQLPFTVVAD
jgi:hypothetical protein